MNGPRGLFPVVTGRLMRLASLAANFAAKNAVA